MLITNPASKIRGVRLAGNVALMGERRSESRVLSENISIRGHVIEESAELGIILKWVNKMKWRTWI